MDKFFARFKRAPSDPAVSTWGNLAQFYSLLIFLIAIPLVLIFALVWITGILGFSTWIFVGFATLCSLTVWRLIRHWNSFKARVAGQASDLNDIMRAAAKNGKDMEVSLLNGVLTLRYRGQQGQKTLPTALAAAPLALAAPGNMDSSGDILQPERVREELQEFLRLRDTGVISPNEFERIKTSLLQRISA